MKKILALVLAAIMLLSVLSACKSSADETPTVDPAETEQTTTEETTTTEEETPEEETQPSQEELDQAAADNVAALIDAIYVQSRTDETDAQCVVSSGVVVCSVSAGSTVGEMCIRDRWTADLRFHAKAGLLTSFFAALPFPVSQW